MVKARARSRSLTTFVNLQDVQSGLSSLKDVGGGIPDRFSEDFCAICKH